MITYVTDTNLTWYRQRKGRGFRYVDDNGTLLPTAAVERIRKLVIPPAWLEVRICPNEHGHIQAIGIDARGRKQYLYHPLWMAHNQEHKFDKMVRFGEVLPTLRETVQAHMREKTLSRERVISTVIWLLEHTFIRVGNQSYARENQSYGLTTLREKHVDIDGNTVHFSFKGKSGVFHDVDIHDRRVVKTVKECIELPGYELFQYIDDVGSRQLVDSRDVNEYLQQITGEELSAKDFRTWGGTTLAGETLYTFGQPETADLCEAAIRQTVKEVSTHLRNTVAVCRKYYIHPRIVESYEQKKLVPYFARMITHQPPVNLEPAEFATWSLLSSS